jgi:hypothetical protein
MEVELWPPLAVMDDCISHIVRRLQKIFDKRYTAFLRLFLAERGRVRIRFHDTHYSGKLRMSPRFQS